MVSAIASLDLRERASAVQRIPKIVDCNEIAAVLQRNCNDCNTNYNVDLVGYKVDGLMEIT